MSKNAPVFARARPPIPPTGTGAPVCGRPGVQVDNLRRTGAEPANLRRRYAYRFQLHAGEGGGVFITDAQTLADARAELLQHYGDRLALVVRA